MKTTLYVLISLFTAFSISAQDITLPLWEGNVPNMNDIEVTEIIDTTDKIRIASVSEPIIEVYLPSESYRTGEAVVICPGGGYRIIAFHYEGTDVAKWLNSHGITAVVLKYRLPHTPNNIEGRFSPFLDAQRALRLTRYNAKEWKIDPNKIGIMGFSAGGHLASTLGTHFNDEFFKTDEIDSVNCRPDFMILMYPVITFKEPYLHRGSRNYLIGENAEAELVDYYSNEQHITENTPPTFLIHAGDDGAVPVENSIMFYENLKKIGVQSAMHIFPEGGHGFGLATGKGYLELWKDLCVSWIKGQYKTE